MKKTILLIIFVLLSFNVSALYISEIMYDPQGTDSGREWVEVYNDGLDLDLSDLRFFENGVAHKMTGGILAHGEYAVIVDDLDKFHLDYPIFEGLVLDSSWSSLSNNGETIGLMVEGLLIDEVFYEGGCDSGKSLTRIDVDNWEPKDPSPWKGNGIVTEIPEFSVPAIILFILGSTFLSAYRR